MSLWLGSRRVKWGDETRPEGILNTKQKKKGEEGRTSSVAGGQEGRYRTRSDEALAHDRKRQ